MTDEVRIREATTRDAGALAALKARAWQAAYAGLLPDDVLAAVAANDETEQWRAYIAARPAQDRLWVAGTPGAELAGYARTGPCPDADAGPAAAEVHGLYVDPGLVGSGLGRALFAHAVDDVAARGATRVVVWHFVGNDRAARFYERAGFAPDGARRASTFGVDEVRRARAVGAAGG